MHRHLHRLWAILVAWVVMAIGLIVLVALGETEGTGFGLVSGALATLTPALLDAGSVERRRRTPGKRAIEDDVS